MINIKEDEYLSKINHSCAHVLAQAVRHLYPEAKFWVGPVIEEGFYYDIDFEGKTLTNEDLEKISKEMKKIIKDGKRIVRHEITKSEALEMFSSDPYKIDLINNMADDETISCYSQGDFTDLCRGPHADTVKECKYFKLLKFSGAYYKGDSKNKMLQRIYGVCFKTEEELNNHLQELEEAKERDHKKLGKELGLFMLSEYGPGFPFWLPNGITLRRILENFWYEEHEKEGYVFVKTPIMLNKELWEKSGHWQNYKENMYTSLIDDREFAIKPMNCPGGMLVYKNTLHSYKELPLRIGELGLVHRHEASGALNGLFRVRNFTQDDAHIFMMESQMEEEIIKLINFIDRIYKIFNLTYTIELSTRPEEKYIGTIAVWDKAETILKNACAHADKEYKINEGDGAFYGPKLDFHVRDSLNREWQCGTIQLDMQLPERFDLNYIDENGEKQRVIMLHRVIFGSVERFIGILIEHFNGLFPLWLAPVEMNILPVNMEYHLEYAKKLQAKLLSYNFRVKLDERDEKLSYKLRDSVMKKIPISIIVGQNEVDNNLVSYRLFGSDETKTIPVNEFIDYVSEKIRKKEL